MSTIEELVEGVLGELVGDCNECCGEERENARHILSRLATEAWLGALRDAIMTAEHHERHWESKHTDRWREAVAIKCDLQATLAYAETPRRGR